MWHAGMGMHGRTLQQSLKAHVIWLDRAEGEVLRGDAHLCERVEEGALAHIGQPHNTNLQQTQTLLKSTVAYALVMMEIGVSVRR